MKHLIALLMLTSIAFAEPFSPIRTLPDNSADKPPANGVTDDDVKSGRPFDTKDGDKCREVWVIGVRQWVCASLQAQGDLYLNYTYPRSGWERQ